jgi:hypothetical protein
LTSSLNSQLNTFTVTSLTSEKEQSSPHSPNQSEYLCSLSHFPLILSPSHSFSFSCNHILKYK